MYFKCAVQFVRFIIYVSHCCTAGQSPREMYSDRRPLPMESAKAVRNQMVPSRAEWRGETDNRATLPVVYCPSTASFTVRPYCKNARRDRCQEYHNCFPLGGLEETTRTSSNYVDEDCPARPEIKQSLTWWGDNCGSESSTLETDVCVWRYAPLVVHATQEEEEEDCRWQHWKVMDWHRSTRLPYRFVSRPYIYGRAIGTVLRPSAVVCTECIVAKRCVLQQKLPLKAYIGSRIWEIDWYQNGWPWPSFRL